MYLLHSLCEGCIPQNTGNKKIVLIKTSRFPWHKISNPNALLRILMWLNYTCNLKLCHCSVLVHLVIFLAKNAHANWQWIPEIKVSLWNSREVHLRFGRYIGADIWRQLHIESSTVQCIKPPVPCMRASIQWNSETRLSFKDYTAICQSVRINGRVSCNNWVGDETGPALHGTLLDLVLAL